MTVLESLRDAIESDQDSRTLVMDMLVDLVPSDAMDDGIMTDAQRTRVMQMVGRIASPIYKLDYKLDFTQAIFTLASYMLNNYAIKKKA